VFGENLLKGLVNANDLVEKEHKIADNLLTRHIETYFAGTIDYEQLTPRFQVKYISPVSRYIFMSSG